MQRTSKLVYTNQEMNIKFSKGNLVSAVASAQECSLNPATKANSWIAKEGDY